MLEPQTLKFLAALKKNNNKPWFEAHRAQYEAARIDFQNVIQLVIDDLQRTDATLGGLQARNCVFRINRDIRFSADKTPYKPNFGASLKREGKKSVYAGYYFHLEPGKSFVGGGLWLPEPDAVKKLRQEIDYNWPEFKKIVTDKKFKTVYGDLYTGSDVSLRNAPKGYEPDSPALAYLKLKSFIAEAPLSDAELTTAALHKKAVDAYRTLQPLLHFINRALLPDD